MPVPGRGDLLLEPLSAPRHQTVQQRLRQALARFAVSAGQRRPWRQALSGACRVEPCDRRTARGVIAVNLPQERTERHQWGEDAVTGLDTCLTDEVDDVLDRQ